MVMVMVILLLVVKVTFLLVKASDSAGVPRSTVLMQIMALSTCYPVW